MEDLEADPALLLARIQELERVRIGRCHCRLAPVPAACRRRRRRPHGRPLPAPATTTPGPRFCLLQLQEVCVEDLERHVSQAENWQQHLNARLQVVTAELAAARAKHKVGRRQVGRAA